MADTVKIKHHSEMEGQLEGEICRRNGCAGLIECKPVEDCYCHINPPCGNCSEPAEFCPVCDWRAKDDEVSINGFLVRPRNPIGSYSSYRPRPLDPTKIDWRSKSHTTFSMIKEGVFPLGKTRSDVEAKVKGTFGGHFVSFRPATETSHGTFKYIAYTD